MLAVHPADLIYANVGKTFAFSTSVVSDVGVVVVIVLLLLLLTTVCCQTTSTVDFASVDQM